MAREIPQNAIEIQEGLYVELHSFKVGTAIHYNSRLYSSENYCFYELNEETPEEEKIYMQHCITPITDIQLLNQKYKSVLKEDTFEIV